MLFVIIIFINLENYIHGNIVFILLLQRWMQRCSSIWCHGWSSYGVLGHLSSTPSRHHFMTSHIRGGAKTVAEALIPSAPSQQQQQQQWHHLHNTTTTNNTTSTTTPHDVTNLWGNQNCAWTLDFPLLLLHQSFSICHFKHLVDALGYNLRSSFLFLQHRIFHMSNLIYKHKEHCSLVTCPYFA